MTKLDWVLAGAAAVAVGYLALVGALIAAGRREDARAAARLIPDCLVLFRRLLGDPRISGWRKAMVAALVAYLVMPFDLVPDFIPVAGQLDDAVAVLLTLRVIARGGGVELLREHWPGPQRSLAVIERLAFGRRSPSGG